MPARWASFRKAHRRRSCSTPCAWCWPREYTCRPPCCCPASASAPSNPTIDVAGGDCSAPRGQARSKPIDLGLTPRQADVLVPRAARQADQAHLPRIESRRRNGQRHMSAVLRALNVMTRTQAIVAAHTAGPRYSSRRRRRTAGKPTSGSPLMSASAGTSRNCFGTTGLRSSSVNARLADRRHRPAWSLRRS